MGLERDLWSCRLTGRGGESGDVRTAPRSSHLLATVLFTDIVDSSRLASELGDRRWRVLLLRHHTIVRKALRRYRGTEIDTAGDGFFARFDDQANAIHCACAIADGVRDLGIEVRSGLHVGQAEVLGKKLGGIVVHTGARIMSEAGPGEVLVSGLLKDLVPGAGITFVDRGVHNLKGIDDRPLFAVVALDGVPRPHPLEPDEAARLRQEIKPQPIRDRRLGRIGVAALALLVVAGSVLFLVTRPARVHVLPNSLVRIDPSTNKVIADVAIAERGGAQLTAVPPHEIWALNQFDQVISIVDANANKLVRTLGVSDRESPISGAGIVFAYGHVWVTATNGEVKELDPRTGAVVSRVRIAGEAGFMAQGYERVWVTEITDVVHAIDPATGKVVLSARTGFGTNGIGVGEHAVWVSNYEDGTVSRVDPRSGDSETFHLWGAGAPLASGPATIATGFDSVWVSDVVNGRLDRVDPETNKVIASIVVGHEPTPEKGSDVVVFDGSVWVASPGSKAIVRVSPDTNRVEETIPLPYAPIGLTVGNGSLWATTASK